jgi:hypothetical protein
MSFLLANRFAARQQLSLLGGVLVNVQAKVGTLSNVLALIERDISLPSENGLAMEKRTIISVLVEEVTNLSKQDKIIFGAETFTVFDVLEKDEFIIKVFVRG